MVGCLAAWPLHAAVMCSCTHTHTHITHPGTTSVPLIERLLQHTYEQTSLTDAKQATVVQSTEQ